MGLSIIVVCKCCLSPLSMVLERVAHQVNPMEEYKLSQPEGCSILTERSVYSGKMVKEEILSENKETDLLWFSWQEHLVTETSAYDHVCAKVIGKLRLVEFVPLFGARLICALSSGNHFKYCHLKQVFFSTLLAKEPFC